MRDLARVFGFAVEADDGDRVAHQLRAHDLDRAPPLHSDVFRQVHLAHAAVANLRHDAIAIGNDRPDEIRRVLGLNQGGAIEEAEHVVRLVARAALRADFFVCHESSPGLASNRRRMCPGDSPGLTAPGKVVSSENVDYTSDRSTSVAVTISTMTGLSDRAHPPTSKRVFWQRDSGNRAWRPRVLMRHSRSHREPRQMSAPPLPQPHRVWLYAAVMVLAVVASATGLSNGFALDDLALVVDNARVHSLDHWWRLFGRPYWPPQYGASLYRPLVTLAHALQWSAGGGAPWVFHLCSIVFYAALSALVLALLFEVIAPLPAVIGASLFAVHPVHVEAVANVVGQSELMASLAMVASCIVYVRARRTGALDASTILLLSTLYGTAVLCKEHALLLPVLLAALEWFVVAAPAPAKWDALAQRARAAAPLVISLFVVAAVYLTTRTVVVGELLGEKHLVPVHGVRAALGHAGRCAAMVPSTRLASSPVRRV